MTHFHWFTVAIVADAAARRGIAARARSCPHAASMSVPRLRRTVAVIPRAREPLGERPEPRRAGGAWPPKPAVGFSGMRFTCAPPTPGNAPSSRPSASACVGESLTPAMQAYSNVIRRPLRAGEVGGGVEHLGDRVAAVERDELVRAARRSRACSDTASVTGSASAGEAADAGDDADGAHGDAAGRDPDVVVEALDRRPRSRRSSRAARPSP